MEIKSLFSTTKWIGGTTTELSIYPEGTTVDERNFDWRISSAVIENEESIFSQFEGYERLIVPISSGLELYHETPQGLLYQRLNVLELGRFSGSWQTKSKGAVTDFNVVFKPTITVNVALRTFQKNQEYVVSSSGQTILYLLEEVIENPLNFSPYLIFCDQEERIVMNHDCRLLEVCFNQ